MDISRIKVLELWLLVTFDLTPTPNAFAFYSLEEVLECWDYELTLGHHPTLFRKELYMLPDHPLYNHPHSRFTSIPISPLRIKK